MFSIFRSRREGQIEVVPSQTEFFRRLEKRCPDRAIFDRQGDDHSEIDLRLVEKIEDILVPLLGRWEQTDRWFHQMDFYGDGVRSLVFRRDLFPGTQLSALQALLAGEHADFTILCCVSDALLNSAESPSQKQPDDYLAIWATSFLVTRQLANVIPVAPNA